MPYRSLYAAVLLALPLMLAAAPPQPNLQPGEWEMTSTTTFPGGVMPEQRDTTRECVTADDLASGRLFDLDDVEECEITSRDIRSDSMNYSMTCAQDGMDMTMDAEMHFLGDRAEGTMSAQMNTPMGPMEMTIVLEGRRIGDC